MTLTEQVRVRLRRLAESRRLNQKQVAARLNVVPSAVSKTLDLKSDRPITIAFAEACADVSGVPVAELLTPAGSLLKQLDADEAALLRYLRRWPRSVTRSLVSFLSFFGDEEPAETQTRNLHELWRGLDANDRGRVFSFALMLREKDLAPDQVTAVLARTLHDRPTRGATRERPPEKPKTS